MAVIALEHWSAEPLAVVCGCALAFHEYGRRALARLGSDTRVARDARGQAWLVRAGLGWGGLTLASPLGYWSHTLLPARAGLDLSFACLVAPLIVLGAPWPAFAAGAGRLGLRRGPAGGSGHQAPVRAAPAGPVTGIAVFLGSLLLWQVPAVLDPSARNSALWAAQIACYLVAGTTLWLQLVASHPFEPRWDPSRRLGLLAAALAGPWIAGVALVITARVRYPAFAPGPIGRVMDQGLAGAITCVLPLIPFGIAALWCFAEWLRKDEDAAMLDDLRQQARTGASPPGPDPMPT